MVYFTRRRKAHRKPKRVTVNLSPSQLRRRRSRSLTQSQRATRRFTRAATATAQPAAPQTNSRPVSGPSWFGTQAPMPWFMAPAPSR